jgi:hypothetical protein
VRDQFADEPVDDRGGAPVDGDRDVLVVEAEESGRSVCGWGIGYLRIALRGRNLSEVRSCCRSEDRPHVDALDH